MSGTTVTLMYLPLPGDGSKPKSGFIAHVGDSRAALVRQKVGGKTEGLEITIDHKVSDRGQESLCERRVV